MAPMHSASGSAQPVWSEWLSHPSAGRFSESAGQTGWALVMFALQAVLRGFELLAALVRGIVKVAICLVAGAGAGLVTVGVFALRQPSLWEYEVIHRSGPPIGPIALGAGVALLTAEVLLIALFFRSWRRAGRSAC